MLPAGILYLILYLIENVKATFSILQEYKLKNSSAKNTTLFCPILEKVFGGSELTGVHYLLLSIFLGYFATK